MAYQKPFAYSKPIQYALIGIFSGSVLVSGLALADAESVGRKVDDAMLTAEVKTRVLADDISRSTNINVDTFQGHVTLLGTVPTDAARRKTEDIAAAVDGVKSVDNKLAVADPTEYREDAKRRAPEENQAGGSAASDSWITAKIKAQLLADDAIDGTEIHVTTEKGVATLTGVVASEAVRERAVAVAKTVKGVTEVDARNLMTTS
jgi:osmotically-inducible protein OsmY